MLDFQAAGGVVRFGQKALSDKHLQRNKPRTVQMAKSPRVERTESFGTHIIVQGDYETDITAH